MSVLDGGCGAGDVALLAAELVGPSGSVTGVDRDPRSVALAARRALSQGLSWAGFRHATVQDRRRWSPLISRMNVSGIALVLMTVRPIGGSSFGT